MSNGKPPSADPTEAQAGEEKPEMVEIHEASIRDLDAAMEDLTKQERDAEEAAEALDEKAATSSAPKAPGATSVAQPETAAPQKPGQAATGKPAAAAATNGATSAAAAQGADRSPEAQAQERVAKEARQNERNAKKESFIQHRNGELATIKTNIAANRKALSDERAALLNGLEERFAENPLKGSEDRERIKEINGQLGDLDNSEQRAQRVVESQTFFLRHVDTEQVSPDDMGAVMKADGLPDAHINQFKANPWEFMPVEALIQVGKRALERKQFASADSDRRLLAKHVLYLNSQLEKLKGKPQQLIGNVQRALRASPVVTSASSSTPRGARDLDPTKMSEAELNSALAKAQGAVQ